MQTTWRAHLAWVLFAGCATLALLLAVALSGGVAGGWTTGVAWLLVALSAAGAAAGFSHTRRQERFRRNLTTGLTHHLRTSLAHVRAYNEMLLLGRESSEDERQAWLEIVGREAERLGCAIENVLLILRADRDLTYAVRRPVDLAALLEDVGCGWRNGDGSPVEFESLAAPAIVDGDEAALRHAINNLFDSLTALSPQEGRISVSLHTAAGHASVELKLLPSDDRAVPTGATGNPPRARQEPDEGSSFGLEAAVADRIFRAHGGKSVYSPINGRFGFRFELPLASPTSQ